MEAGAAVLRIGLELVLNVWRRCVLDEAAVQLDWPSAVFTAEFRVFVHQSFGDWLDLPEGFVASSCAHTAAFDFTIVELFAFEDSHLESPLG
jgi:hypothetical protein